MILCKHWRDCGLTGGGCCAIDAAEKPSFGFCLSVCEKYEGPPRGNLGMEYARTFQPAVVQPCGALIGSSTVQVPVLKRKRYLGDRVEDTLKRFGAKPCPGCNKRKTTLNVADQWGQEQLRKLRKWAVS